MRKVRESKHIKETGDVFLQKVKHYRIFLRYHKLQYKNDNSS